MLIINANSLVSFSQRSLIVCLILIFSFSTLAGQDKDSGTLPNHLKQNPGDSKPSPNPTNQTPTPENTSKVRQLPVIKDNSKLPIIEVVDVFRLSNTLRANNTYAGNENDSAGIGDIIVLKVKNFSTLIGRSNGIIDANGDSVKCPKQQIGLFLDGRLISDLTPESGAPQKDTTNNFTGTLRFHLQRNTTNDEAWADILGSPKNGFFLYKDIPVSVGLVNEYAVPSSAALNLIRIKSTMFYICLCGILCYLIGLFVLAKKSNILRDSWVDASSLGIERKPTFNVFSLGRLQMAFWFSLVIVSYLFIWLITGATDIITSGTLVLIGISAGTALSSVVIGNSKGQDLVKQTSDLKEERAKLNAANAAITPAILADAPAKQSTLNENLIRINEINTAIQQNTTTLSENVSKGFLTDILSDENGVSFHRLQMLVWTLILGFLFINSVWTRLSMPEFSSTLLALQGITSGTYLGFKIPEKQT